jgi:hypothetical protein
MAESKANYTPAESRKRMEAALRGARIVGHQPKKTSQAPKVTKRKRINKAK